MLVCRVRRRVLLVLARRGHGRVLVLGRARVLLGGHVVLDAAAGRAGVAFVLGRGRLSAGRAPAVRGVVGGVNGRVARPRGVALGRHAVRGRIAVATATTVPAVPAVSVAVGRILQLFLPLLLLLSLLRAVPAAAAAAVAVAVAVLRGIAAAVARAVGRRLHNAGRLEVVGHLRVGVVAIAGLGVRGHVRRAGSAGSRAGGWVMVREVRKVVM